MNFGGILKIFGKLSGLRMILIIAIQYLVVIQEEDILSDGKDYLTFLF